IEFLWQRAAGHPGLTVESLRAAAAAGAIRDEDLGIRVDPAALAALPLLPDFESTRLQRVRALSQDAQRAAHVLAACGRPISAATLERIDPSLGAGSLA